MLSGGYSSVPLISEPEEVPEDSFDLMRHLRLNKPSHVTKGMFLEPVTEELEVSSVGSGTVRTKISRKLSNEEGTIVREDSLEQANLESEVLLVVPVEEIGDKGLESNEFKKTKVAEKAKDESLIVVTAEDEEEAGLSHVQDVATTNSEKSSESDAVNFIDYNKEIHLGETSASDSNKNYVSVDFGSEQIEDTMGISPCLPIPAHLKVASVVVQDSFELEEITNEDFNEKESSSSTDPEAGLNVESSDKRLTRENSGESSGFEEMLPDKDTLSPGSSSPTLGLKSFSEDAHVIVSDSRRPLAALLDPEMLSLAVEKARVGEVCEDEKSPRATFAQRRTRSLTKQRPIDEDFLASFVFSPNSPVLRDSVHQDKSLGMKVTHDVSSEDLGLSFNATSKNLKSNIDFSNASPDYVSATDENYNRVVRSEPEKSALEENENKSEEIGLLPGGSVEDELQSNGEALNLKEAETAVISQSEFSSGEIVIRSEGGLPPLTPVTDDNISEQNNDCNKDCEHKKRDDSFTTNGGEHDLSRPEPSVQFGEETENSRDLVAGENGLVSSVPEELTESSGACAQVEQREGSQKPLQKVDSDYQQVSLK